ncbi:hypothetical protein KR044_000781, partial [Drosophila immigrans]
VFIVFLNIPFQICLLCEQFAESGISCTTSFGEEGICISANQCPFAINLLTKNRNNITRMLRNQIRDMACDGEKETVSKLNITFTLFHLQLFSIQQKFPICCPQLPEPTLQTSLNLSYIDPSGMELLDSVTECGKRAQRFKRTILGNGELTRTGEFPWLVLLKYKTSGRPFLCGGSLISDRFVLTAAHCITPSAEIVAVRMGEHNLDTEEDCTVRHGQQTDCLPPYEEFGVEDIRPHPKFDRPSNSYDIALIKLNRSVTFRPHISPICLPIDSRSQSITFDQSFYITGWGRTERRMPSPILLKATVTRQDLDVCRKYYKNATFTENHICAMGLGKQETCRGDSGGPLFFQYYFKRTFRFVQYGVISFGGQSCGINEDQPGVFASVLDMLPWITQNLY